MNYNLKIFIHVVGDKINPRHNVMSYVTIGKSS